MMRSDTPGTKSSFEKQEIFHRHSTVIPREKQKEPIAW